LLLRILGGDGEVVGVELGEVESRKALALAA